MDHQALWVTLERMQENAERVEDRLDAIRDAVLSSRRRVDAWLDAAELRDLFCIRAEARGLFRVAARWRALQREAEQVAEIERERTALLGRRLDQLELTARCAWDDYEDLRRDAESAPPYPACTFGVDD